MTLKDIAKNLNISVATVSKALKDYDDVSAATKARVQDYVEKVKFTPNSVAASLRTQKTKTIGVVIPELNHYFFSAVLSGILTEAEKHDYTVIIQQTHESYNAEKRQIKKLLFKRVDGILISMAGKTNDTQHLKDVVDSETVLIQFDKISKLVAASKIIIDDRKAAFNIVEHLHQQGKKTIAHLRGPLLPQVAIDRFIGYKQALEHFQLSYDAKRVVVCDKGIRREGYTATAKLLQKDPTIDAIFAHTDSVALGAIDYLLAHEIKIPEQVAVVGFSNWEISKHSRPQLTTVNQPGIKMGRVAFQQFLKEVDLKHKKEALAPETIIIPSRLIHRQSS